MQSGFIVFRQIKNIIKERACEAFGNYKNNFFFCSSNSLWPVFIHLHQPDLLSTLHGFSNPQPSNKWIALTPISSNSSTYHAVQLHLEVLEEVPAVSLAGGQVLVLHHSIIAKILKLLLLVEQDARRCLWGFEPVLCSPVNLVDVVCTWSKRKTVPTVGCAKI